MPAETAHHVGGSLRRAIALAATAGFVDAFIFLRIAPVFVANMSGNLVRLGIGAEVREWKMLIATAVSIAGFVIGVSAGATRLDARLRRGHPAVGADLLVPEAGLLLGVAVVAIAASTSAVEVTPTSDLVVLLGAMAMGLQAVALRRVGSVAVSTTYGTGALVRMGEKVALALRQAQRPEGHRRRVTIAVLGIVLAAYVLGAFAGASAGSSRNLLLIPPVVPLVLAGIERRRAATPEG